MLRFRVRVPGESPQTLRRMKSLGVMIFRMIFAHELLMTKRFNAEVKRRICGVFLWAGMVHQIQP